MFSYADDSKLFKHIGKVEDSLLLQEDLDNIKVWLNQWLVKLNVGKCKLISYGRQVRWHNQYNITEEDNRTLIDEADKISGSGVIFDSKLKFEQHISGKSNKAYSILGIIKRNFQNTLSISFINLHKAIVRPHLEYAGCI